MAATLETIVALASSTVRISAFLFLRWIPGHHFPPVIVSAILVYLSTILSYSKSFGTGRPSLREAFPKLFKHESSNPEPPASVEINDIHDEPALYHDERTVVKTLLLGIPDWQEWEFSYLTIAINVLLAVLSLDLVFRGPLLHDGRDLKFSRVGYVDHTSARILFREPDSQVLPVYAYVRASNGEDWRMVDTIYYLGPETDFTSPVAVSNLLPDMEYEYSLSNHLDGSFKTAPSPGTLKGQFLTFVTSSCIKANFPYNPFAHSLSISGFRHLSTILSALPTPASFMMFLGDFIYVDVPFRLSSSPEHYRSEYRRVYASPSWKLPGLNLPWLHTLDDHEIANDWAGGNRTEPFPAASDPFMQYHVSVNPPLPPSAPKGSDTNSTYFQFTQGPASFFMMDTRRYRTAPEASSKDIFGSSKPLYGSSPASSQQARGTPSMLGATQLHALLVFLTTPEPPNVHWKIVATSVPFTKNWRFGTPDTWGGFLSERRKILEAMHLAEQNLGVRIVILSGDRHEFAAVRYAPPTAHPTSAGESNYDATPGLGPHEFSVGPLSMFYLPIRTFKQIDDEDVTLAYFPDGNSKLGVIEISPTSSSLGLKHASSSLKYSLWVDGATKWEYTLNSPSPQKQRRSNLRTWFPQ